MKDIDFGTVLMILFLIFLLIAVVSVKLDTLEIRRRGGSLLADLEDFLSKEKN
jgi:hypothetical protein